MDTRRSKWGRIMDTKTIAQYDENSERFLEEWTDTTPPALAALMVEWFRAGSSVLDIGSGGGRDVVWMLGQGYRARGVDASLGLLAASMQRYPSADFRRESLPHLAAIGDQSEDNIFCSGVLMHLSDVDIPVAVMNMMRIVRLGGRVICSFRASREQGSRESDGRLFTSIEINRLAEIFEKNGGSILSRWTASPQKDGRIWNTLAVEKSG
jgi:SAM-dependent methyltransferase